MNHIVIRGARQHNLKNIDLTLPRNRFIVITGVSGSGKSSLAFDTLFAEGQRRYVESLSTYARQFLHRFDATQVDEIQGLSPAIAIEQKGLSKNPRSTVGTLTEIYDYLRLLYARLGTVYCPVCAKPIRAYTLPQMLQEVFRWPEKSRLLILAPLGRVTSKELPNLLKKLRRDGFVRVRVDTTLHELDPLPRLPPKSVYELDVVIDRLILDKSKSRRLSDSLELASKTGRGSVKVAQPDGEESVFSESFCCMSCGREMSRPSPTLFSFSHPSGTCPMCKGLGYLKDGDRLPDRNFETEDIHSSSSDAWAVCPVCVGTRLNETAQSVRLGNLGIHEVSQFSVPDVRNWLTGLKFSEVEAKIASRPVEEIRHRLDTLDELGLSYLTLNRSAHTLSGGEAQRVRLAHQISSPLCGVLYVLDEPSIGLHPRDHQRLLDILFKLRDAENTLVVVEHDAETMLQADHVVDMGPGAGILGGEVIFAGSPQGLLLHPSSLTGQYLSGQKKISVPKSKSPFLPKDFLILTGAKGHNLKNITVRFPLGCITCVTGVSGSGKSTLVLHTLYRILAQRLHGSRQASLPFDRLEGADTLQKVIHIDQSPLGRSSRSIPATYMGVFSLIRQLFSQLPEAKARGYRSERFSFNTKGGRCETCKGEGIQTIEMVFLPDVHVTCADCGGTRYNYETLEIRFKGKSIAEILEMTIHQASGFFENLPALRNKLETFQEVGLGYLRLGQPAPTLSGGEAQRVKLARELSRKTTGKTLYLLDEPTTGLHFDDIAKLLHVLRRLVEIGHTVIIIEHHPDVIKNADYVIDLGPEGGEKGGQILVSGTPEEVACADNSFTGRYLREIL